MSTKDDLFSAGFFAADKQHSNALHDQDPLEGAFRRDVNEATPKIEIKKSEYPAIVLKVVDGYPPEYSHEAYMTRNLGLSPRKTFYLIVTLPYDPLPQKKLKKLCEDNNDLIEMRADTYGYFIAESPNTPKPQCGELVRVRYTYQGGSAGDFKGGVYLGRWNDEHPRVASWHHSSRVSATSAFRKVTEEDGLIPMKMMDNDQDEPKLSGDASHWRAPMTKKRIMGILTHQIESKHEIYVDQKSDYPDIKKIKILPASAITKNIDSKNEVMYRKDNIGYLLPEDKPLRQRKATRMFIIRETRGSQHVAYDAFNALDVYKDPIMHYNIVNLPSNVASTSRCVINVNVPYGMIIGNTKNPLSNNAVGCIVSSPLDGDAFLDQSSRWDNRVASISEVENSSAFLKFKAKYNNWIENKALPDNSEAFILGPYGTPGLRTGPNASQKLKVSDITNKAFWEGKLVWTKWGHYFLPSMKQAAALYDLVSSIISNPPTSLFSWGFKQPDTKHMLKFNFPAVGGGDALYPSSNFIINSPAGKKTEPGFPWGHVGSVPQRGALKPYKWWTKKLLSGFVREQNEASGIVAQARWKSSEGVFLEYYLLARSLGLAHKDAWYVTLASASQTYSSEFGGIGFGPSSITTDAELNKLLQQGQRMWFVATNYMRKSNVEAKGVGRFSRSVPQRPSS